MAAEDANDLVWELYLLGRPRGTHFSDGTSSALLFDDGTNALQTHAVRGPRFEDVESEHAPELLMLAVGIAAGVSLTIGITRAAPRLKTLWNDLWSKQSRYAAARDVDDGAQGVALSAISVEDFSNAVDVALEDRTMSSAEAQRRIVGVLLAAAFIAENLRALSRAQIEDGAPADLQATIERLTVPQLTASLNRMLERDSFALDDDTSVAFMQIFAGGRSADGQYVPVQIEKVKEALRSFPEAADARLLPGERDGSTTP